VGCCSAAAGILLGLTLLDSAAQGQPGAEGPSASLAIDLDGAHVASAKGMHAVVIPLSETDPFWVYWDPTINGVAWTRL
jgi:hypothetical protein